MIKLQNDLIQSLTAENWERSKDEEIVNVQRELQNLVETQPDSEYINSIQFILPELKIESIETYSPQNHSKFLFHSPSPSLTRVDSLPFSSPNLKSSLNNLPNDYEPKKIDFKLHKVKLFILEIIPISSFSHCLFSVQTHQTNQLQTQKRTNL